MANLNKVMLIGRLTRDPEVRTFGTTGGKVAAFGFAVNNKKKNAQTGQWEDKNGGGKRSKHVLVVDNFQFLEPRQDGGSGEGGFQPRRAATQPARSAPAAAPQYDEPEPQHGGGEEGEIPF